MRGRPGFNILAIKELSVGGTSNITESLSAPTVPPCARNDADSVTALGINGGICATTPVKIFDTAGCPSPFVVGAFSGVGDAGRVLGAPSVDMWRRGEKLISVTTSRLIETN
jgi:hypothetical protein